MNMPSRDWSIVRLRTGIKPTHRIGDLSYVEHLKTKNRPGHLVLSGSARTGSDRTVHGRSPSWPWTVSSSVSPYWPFRHSVFSNTLWHFVFNKKSIQLKIFVLFQIQKSLKFSQKSNFSRGFWLIASFDWILNVTLILAILLPRSKYWANLYVINNVVGSMIQFQ